MTDLSTLVLIGGVLHFGVLIASALVPQVLDWRKELASLSTLTRQLVWVHGAFIVMVIVGFGVISLTVSAELASGSPLARWVCGFIAVFWATRLALQFVLFDPTPHMGSAVLKWGYHGLTVLFLYFAAVYGWAAVAT